MFKAAWLSKRCWRTGLMETGHLASEETVQDVAILQIKSGAIRNAIPNSTEKNFVSNWAELAAGAMPAAPAMDLVTAHPWQGGLRASCFDLLILGDGGSPAREDETGKLYASLSVNNLAGTNAFLADMPQHGKTTSNRV